MNFLDVLLYALVALIVLILVGVLVLMFRDRD